MGDTLDAKKIRLVSYIAALKDEAFLDLLEKLFERAKTIDSESGQAAILSIRQSQDTENVGQKQDDRSLARERFRKIFEGLDIDDPAIELLKSLADDQIEADYESHSLRSEVLKNLLEPIEEKIDLKKVLRQQNYKGPDKRRFDRLVKELDIQEPIEDLLALLSK